MITIDNWVVVTYFKGHSNIAGTVDGRAYHTSILEDDTLDFKEGDTVVTQYSKYKLGKESEGAYYYGS